MRPLYAPRGWTETNARAAGLRFISPSCRHHVWQCEDITTKLWFASFTQISISGVGWTTTTTRVDYGSTTTLMVPTSTCQVGLIQKPGRTDTEAPIPLQLMPQSNIPLTYATYLPPRVHLFLRIRPQGAAGRALTLAAFAPRPASWCPHQLALTAPRPPAH